MYSSSTGEMASPGLSVCCSGERHLFKLRMQPLHLLCAFTISTWPKHWALQIQHSLSRTRKPHSIWILLLSLRKQRKSIIFLRHMWRGKRTLGHRPRVLSASVWAGCPRPGSGTGACSWFAKISRDRCVCVSITLLKCQL